MANIKIILSAGKRTVKLMLLTFAIIVLSINLIQAQLSNTLSGVYNKLHLTKNGYYVVEAEVIVKDTLIADPGVRILFKENGFINALGNVKFDANTFDRIHLSSFDNNKMGAGLIISNPSTDCSVNITYTNFEGLLSPLSFKADWERKKVNISHCQFYNNKGDLYVLELNNPNLFNVSLNDYVIDFSLTQNLFANNQSSIFIQDLNLEQIKFTIKENVFYGNSVKGQDYITFANNFIAARLDNKTSLNDISFYNNVFLHNTLKQITADTIIRNANVGVFGSKTFIDMSNNYWGESVGLSGPDTFEIPKRLGIIDRNTDYNSPKVIFQPASKYDSDILPPHIYQVKKQSAVIDDDFDYRGSLAKLTLVANKKVNTKKMKVHYTGYLDSVFIKDTLLSYRPINSNNEDSIITIELGDKFLPQTVTGYLYIDGIEGTRNELVPAITVGYKKYLAKKYEINTFGLARIMPARVPDTLGKAKIELDTAIHKITNTNTILPIVKYKKRFELGMVSGLAIYYGTVSNRSIFKNDANLGIGIKVRYILNSFLSASFTAARYTLSNSDSKSGDSLYITRGVKFRDPVLNLSLSLDYSFLNNEYFDPNKKVFKPYFGFGIEYIRFNPQGYYLGQWYNLQPLKTGGQKTPYSLTTIGIPVSVGVRYNISKNYSMSAQAEYHMAFTDYLDDVGADVYPAKSSFTGSNAAMAYYFSNPTNKNVRSNELRNEGGSNRDCFFNFSVGFYYRF